MSGIFKAGQQYLTRHSKRLNNASDAQVQAENIIPDKPHELSGVGEVTKNIKSPVPGEKSSPKFTLKQVDREQLTRLNSQKTLNDNEKLYQAGLKLKKSVALLEQQLKQAKNSVHKTLIRHNQLKVLLQIRSLFHTKESFINLKAFNSLEKNLTSGSLLKYLSQDVDDANKNQAQDGIKLKTFFNSLEKRLLNDYPLPKLYKDLTRFTKLQQENAIEQLLKHYSPAEMLVGLQNLTSENHNMKDLSLYFNIQKTVVSNLKNFITPELIHNNLSSLNNVQVTKYIAESVDLSKNEQLQELLSEALDLLNDNTLSEHKASAETLIIQLVNLGIRPPKDSEIILPADVSVDLLYCLYDKYDVNKIKDQKGNNALGLLVNNLDKKYNLDIPTEHRGYINLLNIHQPNTLNQDGDSPAHLIAKKVAQFKNVNETHTYEELLSAENLDLDLPNKDGLTPLNIIYSIFNKDKVADDLLTLKRNSALLRLDYFFINGANPNQKVFHDEVNTKNLNLAEQAFKDGNLNVLKTVFRRNNIDFKLDQTKEYNSSKLTRLLNLAIEYKQLKVFDEIFSLAQVRADIKKQPNKYSELIRGIVYKTKSDHAASTMLKTAIDAGTTLNDIECAKSMLKYAIGKNNHETLNLLLTETKNLTEDEDLNFKEVLGRVEFDKLLTLAIKSAQPALINELSDSDFDQESKIKVIKEITKNYNQQHVKFYNDCLSKVFKDVNLKDFIEENLSFDLLGVAHKAKNYKFIEKLVANDINLTQTYNSSYRNAYELLKPKELVLKALIENASSGDALQAYLNTNPELLDFRNSNDQNIYDIALEARNYQLINLLDSLSLAPLKPSKSAMQDYVINSAKSNPEADLSELALKFNYGLTDKGDNKVSILKRALDLEEYQVLIDLVKSGIGFKDEIEATEVINDLLASKENLGTLTELVKLKPAVLGYESEKGKSLLILAMDHLNYDAIDFLLSYNLNHDLKAFSTDTLNQLGRELIDLEDDNSKSPTYVLYGAENNSKLTLLRKLVKSGMTLLDSSALDLKAPLNLINKRYNTNLSSANELENPYRIYSKDVLGLKQALAEKDYEAFYNMIVALRENQYIEPKNKKGEYTEKFIQALAGIDSRKLLDKSILELAVLEGNYQLLDKLLAYWNKSTISSSTNLATAKVNQLNKDGRTLAHLVAINKISHSDYKNREILKVLEKYDLDFAKKDIFNKSADQYISETFGYYNGSIKFDLIHKNLYGKDFSIAEGKLNF